MNAVAMMTPVPKCFTEKNTHVGIRSFLTRFATIGNSAPYPKSAFVGQWKGGQLPKVELRRMANRPKRCSPRSASLIPSASLVLHRRMGLFSRSIFYVINTEGLKMDVRND